MIVTLLLGCPDAPTPEVDYSLLRPDSADATAALATSGSRFGAGLRAVDFDGNGVDELLVGTGPTTDVEGAESSTWVLDGASLTPLARFEGAATALSAGMTDAGPVFVSAVSWEPALESATLRRVDDPLGPSPTTTLLGMDRVNDVTLADLDGDGASDLVVASLEQGLYVYSGLPETFPESPPMAQLTAFDSHFLSAAAMDVDGDGVDELLGGAWMEDDPEADRQEEGAVYVFEAPFSGDVAASDARAVVYGTRHVANGFIYEGETGRRVSDGGDLDGDGLPETLIAAKTWFWGASLAARGTQRLTEMALLRLDGEDGHHDEPGESAATLDVDGDGVLDLLVGAPGAQVSGYPVGAVYLLYGPVSGQWDLGAAAEVKLAAATPDDELGATLAVVRGPDGLGVVVGAPGTQAGSDTEAGALWLWGAAVLAGG